MRLLTTACLALLFASTFTFAADEPMQPLFDFASAEHIAAENGAILAAEQRDGLHVVRLSFDGTKTYPGLTIPATLLTGSSDNNLNLTKLGYVSVDVTNTSDTKIAVGINVKNDGDWRTEPFSSNILRLDPGKSGTLTATLGEKYNQPNPKFDPAKIIGVQLFVGGPKAPGSVVFSNLRAHGLPKPPPSRFAFEPAKGPFPSRLQLLSFDENIIKQTSANEGNVTAQFISDGDYHAIRITTPGDRDWPGLQIKAPSQNLSPLSPGGRWDLSHYQYISLDLRNVDTKDIEIFVRVDNPGANGSKNCVTKRTFTQPGQRVTLTIPIPRVSDSKIQLVGMIGYPQGLYPQGVGLDTTNIIAIVPFTGKKSGSTNSFEISNVFASGIYEEPPYLNLTPDQFFPMVDRFGQFKHKDWPGKIHNDAELQSARESESAALASDLGSGPKSWDQWGGWADGPTLKATGHFRVEKYQNRWWFVDPDGHLFFSTGLTGVGFGGGSTPIEGRENYFTDLPDRAGDDPLAKFYSKSYRQWSGFYAGKEPLTYDFSRANLYRKYGPDFQTLYPPLVHRRLRAWGINTLGNWSDGRFMKLDKTPYTTTLYYSAPKLNPRGAGFPDVFDDKFAPAVAKGAAQFLKGTTDDPWCIGYFVDNEMPWGGDTTLARLALQAPASQAAKIKLVAWLTDKYKTIDALNTAWASHFADWPAFAADVSLNPQNPQAVADLTDFTELIAETYFKTIRDALRAIAPDKLYLGCRSVGSAVNMARAAVKYCDVVSYNHYAHSVADLGCPGAPGQLDAPILIGEFHFCATDRGLFWSGLVTADNQADRGKLYQNYVRSALDNPLIVGVHWFQYGDESVTGRGDGENAQCGFIDVCDTPYKETTDAARAIADTMYPQRAGK